MTGVFSCAGIRALAFALTLFGLFSPAFAQDFVFVRNRANPTLFLSNVDGKPVAAAISARTPSTQWMLEPIPGELLMRIKNRNQGAYLQTPQGALELGILARNPVSTAWQIEPVEGTLFVRIRNAQTGLYLTLQEATGPLGVGPLLEVGSTDTSTNGAAGGPPLLFAPPPGLDGTSSPSVVDWEFIKVGTGSEVGTALTAMPAVPMTTLMPVESDYTTRIRQCTGGRIWYSGACRCPVEAIERDGFCVMPRFECKGGNIVGLQCQCPGWRIPIATGRREYTCLFPRQAQACPPGTYRIRDGSCVSNVCPTGQVYSSSKQQCVPMLTTTCTNGTVRDGACFCQTGLVKVGRDPHFTCVPPKPLVFCTGGTVQNGNCVCPANFKLTGTAPRFTCVKPAVQITCTGGTVNNGKCVCPSGTKRSGSSPSFSCVAKPKTGATPITCSGGTVNNGKCVCPSGTKRSGSSPNFSCVPKQKTITTPITCSGGTVNNGKCICPTGKKLNGNAPNFTCR